MFLGSMFHLDTDLGPHFLLRLAEPFYYGSAVMTGRLQGSIWLVPPTKSNRIVNPSAGVKPRAPRWPADRRKPWLERRKRRNAESVNSRRRALTGVSAGFAAEKQAPPVGLESLPKVACGLRKLPPPSFCTSLSERIGFKKLGCVLED